MKDQFRTPLRSVLRNFLNHIEKLESSSCPESSYDAEFQSLKLFSESVKSQKEYACTEGEKETNRKKNRYKDILPFDVSRVILNEYVGIPGSDYINANYIKGASGSPAYIASQGPLPCTVNDFWRMVVQCEVQVIVMACNEEEAGKAKCEKYWVDEGEEKQFGMISVKLLKASTVCPDFSVRTMRLKYTNNQNVVEERTVCQLHYVAWPDHGVPTVVQPLLEMVRLVRDTQASETLPVLVHCSAGCGRTGTICAIDYVWGLLRTGKLTDDFSLLGLIREMRRQRISMVQTKEQYVLVHQAVRELFKEQLLMIDSHPYENVDPEGLLIMKEEENHYDTVENICNMNYDEKKDSTMEKDVAPPLPQKKHSVYSSKQEKDVENLSAQQRSINLSGKKYSSKAAAPAPKPSVLGEKQQSTSQVLRKRLPNPIPSKGILRVPHLKHMNSTPVKRSKSLKLTNSAFKQNMSVSPDVPTEIRRRGSLESNIDETASIAGEDIASTPPANDFNSPRDLTISDHKVNTPSHLKKYSMLNYLDEKRPLVRSLTTFDMRHKHVAPSAPPDDKDVVPSPGFKCRLSRSNTQVDFSRLFVGRATSKRLDQSIQPAMKNPVGPSRKHSTHDSSPLSIFISHPSESKPIPSERTLRPNFKDKLNDPHSIYQSPSVGDDFHLSQSGSAQKEDFKWNPLLRNDAPYLLMSPSQDRKPPAEDANVRKLLPVDRLQEPSASNSRGFGLCGPVYQYEKKYECFSHEEKVAQSSEVSYSSPLRRSQFVDMQMYREPTHKNHSTPQQVHVPVINSRPNKNPYVSDSPLAAPLRLEPRGSKQPGRFDLRNPLPVRELPAKEFRGMIPPRKVDGNSPALHTDHQGNHPSYSKAPSHSTFPNKEAMVQKQLELSNSKAAMKLGRTPFGENDPNKGVKQVVDKMAHDVPIRPKASNSPNSRSWHSNHTPNYRLTSQEVSKPEDNAEDAKRNSHQDGSCVPPVGVLHTLVRQDADSKDCDYFSNAPGVDIDQVAASIPQKDMSKSKLMKVALEAFNIRRSRQQARLPDSSPSSSSSSKGSSSSSSLSASGKKKQQQYL